MTAKKLGPVFENENDPAATSCKTGQLFLPILCSYRLVLHQVALLVIVFNEMFQFSAFPITEGCSSREIFLGHSPDREKYQHEINKKENKNYPGDYGVSGKLTSDKGFGRSR